MAVNGNYGANANYPSSLSPNTYRPVDVNQEHETWVGKAVHALQPVNDDDYVQASALWEVLGRTQGQQDHFVYNVSSHLFAAKDEVRRRTYEMFSKVSEDLGQLIRNTTEKAVESAGSDNQDAVVEQLTAQLR
jgi:catalase